MQRKFDGALKFTVADLAEFYHLGWAMPSEIAAAAELRGMVSA